MHTESRGQIRASIFCSGPSFLLPCRSPKEPFSINILRAETRRVRRQCKKRTWKYRGPDGKPKTNVSSRVRGSRFEFGPCQGYRKLFITALNRKSFSYLTLRPEGNFYTPVESIRVVLASTFQRQKGVNCATQLLCLKIRRFFRGKEVNKSRRNCGA